MLFAYTIFAIGEPVGLRRVRETTPLDPSEGGTIEIPELNENVWIWDGTIVRPRDVSEDQAAQNAALAVEIHNRSLAVIEAEVPQWRQIAYNARAFELLDKQLGGRTLTTEEEAEMANIRVFWGWVAAVRSAADAAEASSHDPSVIVWPSLPT